MSVRAELGQDQQVPHGALVLGGVEAARRSPVPVRTLVGQDLRDGAGSHGLLPQEAALRRGGILPEKTRSDGVLHRRLTLEQPVDDVHTHRLEPSRSGRQQVG